MDRSQGELSITKGERIETIQVLLITQVINGLLLPIILVAVLRLSSDKELMGKYANGFLYQVAAWLTVLIVSALSLIFIAAPLFSAR